MVHMHILTMLRLAWALKNSSSVTIYISHYNCKSGLYVFLNQKYNPRR